MLLDFIFLVEDFQLIFITQNSHNQIIYKLQLYPFYRYILLSLKETFLYF